MFRKVSGKRLAGYIGEDVSCLLQALEVYNKSVRLNIIQALLIAHACLIVRESVTTM